MRSRESLVSTVDVVGAIEGVSFDLRDSGGEVLSTSFSFSLGLSFDLPLNSMVNEGAAGLSFGVAGLCEEAGRVPIGA